jgi:hypothetical protein
MPLPIIGLIELLVLLAVVALVVVILCRTLWAKRQSRGFEVLPPTPPPASPTHPEIE